MLPKIFPYLSKTVVLVFLLLTTKSIDGLNPVSSWSVRGSGAIGVSLPDQVDNYISDGSAVDLSRDGDIIAIGNGPTDGSVRVLEFSQLLQAWTPRGQNIPPDRFNQLGRVVALSGDGSVLAVGATYYVRTFRYDPPSDRWIQNARDISGVLDIGLTDGIALDLSEDGQVLALRTGRVFHVLGVARVYHYNFGRTQWDQIGQGLDGSLLGFNMADGQLALSGDGRVLALAGLNYDPLLSVRLRVRVWEYSLASDRWNERGMDLDYEESEALNRDYASLSLSEDGNVLAVARNTEGDFNLAVRNGFAQVYYFDAFIDGYVPWGKTILGGLPNVNVVTDIALTGTGRVVAVASQSNVQSSTAATIRIFQVNGALWEQIGSDISYTRPRNGRIRPVLAISKTGRIVASGGRDSRGSSDNPSSGPFGAVVVYENVVARSPFVRRGWCFPEDAVVHVKDQGPTQMKDLQLGDWILVQEGDEDHEDDVYEEVYSFGHKLAAGPQEFQYVRLTVGHQDLHHLTLSPDHLVFVGSEGQTRPAALLKVGQQVQVGHPDNLEPIVAVDFIKQTSGLYAPFTSSGSLLVNGVRVSSFASLQGTEWVELKGNGSFWWTRWVMPQISHHWFNRMLALPCRLYRSVIRKTVSFGSSPEETYRDDGIPTWLKTPMSFYTWWSRQSESVQTMVAIPIVVTVLLLGVVDLVVLQYPFMGFTATVLVAVALWWGYCSWVWSHKKQTQGKVLLL